jgi:D-glycero-beta-D-manno-heptose-7-phosphate kinase
MKLQEPLDSLSGQHILVVGDVMLDRYIQGAVTRISPEAPVPVVLQQQIEDRLGGAANVALNIAAMRSIPVLCSVIGHDTDGAALEQLLVRHQLPTDGLVRVPSRITTVKTRILGNQQQMLRVDSEQTHDLSPQEAEELIRRVSMLIRQFPIKAIILQDYNKGVLSAHVIEQILAEARKADIPVAVDPKKKNFFAYRGVSLFKPNLKEIRDSVPLSIAPELSSLQRAADFLRQHLHHRITMITLSEHGLFLEDHIERESGVFPTHVRNVADVSGAGDTVISIATLALAAQWSLESIALVSNAAGGQVCSKIGVVPVDFDLLGQQLNAIQQSIIL